MYIYFSNLEEDVSSLIMAAALPTFPISYNIFECLTPFSYPNRLADARKKDVIPKILKIKFLN